MYGTEYLINTASLLMLQCYLTCLAHTKSSKELSRRTQLGLASGPPALLTRKTVCSQFTAMAESPRVYLYLQGIQCVLNSLLWPKVLGYIFICRGYGH